MELNIKVVSLCNDIIILEVVNDNGKSTAKKIIHIGETIMSFSKVILDKLRKIKKCNYQSFRLVAWR